MTIQVDVSDTVDVDITSEQLRELFIEEYERKSDLAQILSILNQSAAVLRAVDDILIKKMDEVHKEVIVDFLEEQIKRFKEDD